MNSQSVNGSEIERAIRSLDQKFMEHIAARDHEGLANGFYTDDAYVVARGRPLVKGKNAVSSFWREFMLKDVVGLTLTPSQIEAEGHLAFSVGTYTLRTIECLENGKYLVVYRQGEDGGWARAAESFISDD